MNLATYGALWLRTAYSAMLWSRRLGRPRPWKAYGESTDVHLKTIEQTYVINLNREPDRWNRMQRELRELLDRSRRPLSETTTRFPAIDARLYKGSPDPSVLQTTYILADQLFVDPEPALDTERFNRGQGIEMSRQEIAIAMSHIAVWKLIASGARDYSLVLEDDVYFRFGFERLADRAWAELHTQRKSVDMLYLSFKEAMTKAQRREDSGLVFRPVRGLWQLSGYVLSRAGAQRLLELLPVRGPVDLWVNLQFERLEVFATSKSIIQQRRDVSSGNSYSVLPVLAGLGVLTREKPKKYGSRQLPRPVFACGDPGTGLTSLAMALSMLGYRCCSDVLQLPEQEHRNLFERRRGRVFDAYVNVASIADSCLELAGLYPGSKFIVTVAGGAGGGRAPDSSGPNEPSTRTGAQSATAASELTDQLSSLTERLLVLPLDHTNRWDRLCRFLDRGVPNSAYPDLADIEPRGVDLDERAKIGLDVPIQRSKWDRLPWIVGPARQWRGMVFGSRAENSSNVRWVPEVRERFDRLEAARWEVLDDTFPDNLALFREANFTLRNPGCAALYLRKGGTNLRPFTSASLRTRNAYQYGRFEAAIRPAKGRGLVTGMFLHRNSPRQEIDIEFLGRNTTRLMVNVYYNPGGEGATLEYGYRGTPAVIDLGFDASEAFHRYSIAWTPSSITWFVDGRMVHERVNWNPTPIPHLPMRFFINLWPPRSKQLAGVLSLIDLPAKSEIRSVDIDVWK